MKATHLSLTVALAAAALGGGCAATETAMESNTGRKAAGGALAGAVVGGIIGNNSSAGTGKGAAIGAAVGGLAGAAVGHQQDKRADNVYTADNQIVVQSPPLTPTSQPYEAIPPRPYPNAVWIPGHYSYNGATYMWESGRWENPPSGATSWILPSWQPTAGGYIYVRGHWQ
jgi:hypothetical protein